MYPEATPKEFLTVLPDLSWETATECEIILPEYCPNVLKILRTDVTVTVRNKTVTDDRLTAEGKAEYTVLYLSEEGCGIFKLTQSVPFACQTERKSEGESDVFLSVIPVNATARALNPRKVYARCSLQLRASEEGVSALPPLPEDGRYEVLRRRKAAVTKVGYAEKPLRITDTWEECIGEGITLLKKSIRFGEREQKALTERLIVKADMTMELLCTDGTGRLFTQTKTVPVSQILDVANVGDNRIIDTKFLLSLFEISEEETPDGRRWSYDVEINVACRVYGEKTAEWAADVYSPETLLESTEIPLQLLSLRPVSEQGSIRERVEISSASELLQTEITPVLKGIFYRQEESAAVCEGVWVCKFLLTDGDGIPAAEQREVPFRLELPAEAPFHPVRNGTELQLTDVSARLTDGTHVEFIGTYRWSGLIFEKSEETAVSEIRHLSDRPKKETGIVLYYASAGESSWEIAKEHACHYGDFRRENGLTEDRIPDDRMLMILH